MKKALDEIHKITDALKKLNDAAKKEAFVFRNMVETLDALTAKHTSFKTFSRLVHTPQFYPSFPKFPTTPIDPELEADWRERELLILCYDMAQEARGDTRRVHRT